MDKLQRIDYLGSIENYLEDNEIYELLGDLLKEIIIHRPKDPLDFIVERLKHTNQPGKYKCLRSRVTAVSAACIVDWVSWYKQD